MKNLTEIVFILDESGSMAGMEKDVIGGFNSFIKKQMKEDCDTIISTVLFNNSYKLIHDRVDINKIDELTEKDYCPCGSTALLDAVGITIRNIQIIQDHSRRIDIPDKTIFVITTDGMENSSREYTYSCVKALIKESEQIRNWHFMFLADNLDAAQYAENLGIRRNMAANYDVSKDTRHAFNALYRCCNIIRDDDSDRVTLSDLMEDERNKDE